MGRFARSSVATPISLLVGKSDFGSRDWPVCTRGIPVESVLPRASASKRGFLNGRCRKSPWTARLTGAAVNWRWNCAMSRTAPPEFDAHQNCKTTYCGQHTHRSVILSLETSAPLDQRGSPNALTRLIMAQNGDGIILLPPQFSNIKDFVASCATSIVASLVFLILTGFLGGLVLWGATGFSASFPQILQIMFFYA